jgi:hypothetical protein
MNSDKFFKFSDILVLLLSGVSSDFVLLILVLLELGEVTSPVSQLFALKVDHFGADSVQEVSGVRHDNDSSVF